MLLGPIHPSDRLFASPRARRVALAGFLVLLVGLGCVSLDRALRFRFDFSHFYLDARYVWEHHALNNNFDAPRMDDRRQLPFYLPVVPLTLSLVTAFGQTPAAVIWAAAQVAAAGYSLTVLRRWGAPHAHSPDEPGAPERGVGALGAYSPLAIASLLSLFALYDAAKFNQLSYAVLALVLAGLTALERRRPITAGALLAAAAVLKLLPAIFLLWLVLKRQWSAAISFLAAAAVIILIPPLLAFGWSRTLEYHAQWWQHNVRGDAARSLVNPDLPEHFIDHRNESIGQVVARWAWPDHPFRMRWQIAQLDQATCARIAYGLAGVLLLALVWQTRRPWAQLDLDARRGETAVYALGMLVFSPLLREYYLVWCLPALVLLAKTVLWGASERRRRLGALGLLLWAIAMLAWPFRLPRLSGLFLVMLIGVGIVLLAIVRTRGAASAARPSTSSA